MAKFFHPIFVAVLAMILIIWTPPLIAQEGEVIESLKIIGNKRIDESTILYYIQSKPGTVLSKETIRKDIEQIFSLGQFKDIQVDTQGGIEGLKLQFIIEEIPFELLFLIFLKSSSAPNIPNEKVIKINSQLYGL